VLIDNDAPDALSQTATPIATISEYLGIQTNNVAEYTGVVRAVTLGRELGAARLELLLDSNLIVEQLHGRWRVKDAKLRPLWAEILRLLRELPAGWTASHVRREQNTIADALANEAIDRAQAGGPYVVVRRPR
jgi:ribonuclease HI